MLALNIKVSKYFRGSAKYGEGNYEMEKPNVNSSSALTGCISGVSVIKPPRHAYFDALKDYAVHYADAQAYLAVDHSLVTHDNSSIDNSPIEFDHGLLGDDGEPVRFSQISDEDIDKCGYMGWLRH